MSCPTQKSFHEKISRFLEKMLSNVFRVHLSYLPSAVLQTAIAFLFTVLTKLFLLALYRLVFNGYYEFCLMECLWAQKKGYNALYICLNRTRILLILGILLF
jgi:hypothetical protein